MKGETYSNISQMNSNMNFFILFKNRTYIILLFFQKKHFKL